MLTREMSWDGHLYTVLQKQGIGNEDALDFPNAGFFMVKTRHG